MTDMHKSSLLPIKNRVLSVDEHTTFLAHYDLNEQDVLRGTKAIGKPTAFYFNGTTHIRIANPLKNTEEFTIAFWMKHDNPAAWSDVFTFDTGNDTTAMRLEWSGSNYRWFGTGALQNSAILFNHDGSKWEHIAIVSGGQNAYVYQNGELVYSGAKVSASLLKTIEYINIGQRITYSYWKGSMHSFVMYNRAMNQEEIRNVSNSMILENGLVGHWEMTHENDKIMADSSPFHSDGIITGSVNFSKGNSIFTLRPQEGKFGGAIAVEESTTNLITEYAATYRDLSIGQSYTADVKEGQIRVTRTGQYRFLAEYLSDVTYGILNLTVPFPWPAGKQTISATILRYYEAPGTMGRFGLGRSSSGNPSLHGSDSLGWKQATITDSVNMENIRLGLRSGDAVIKAGSYIEWEFFQLENKPFATSFVDGLRSNGIVEYSLDLDGDFTIALYYKSVAPRGYAKDKNVIALTNGTNHFNFFNGHTEDWFMGDETSRTRFKLSDRGAPTTNFEYLVIVREGTIIKLYRNGILTDSKDFGAAPRFTRLSLCGGYGLQGQNPNGMVDELRVDTIARTEEEILAWYESNSPFWPRGIYRKSY